MINKIELSAALSALATNSSIDKVTGTLSGAASNISTADLATVVAGLMTNIVAFRFGTISSIAAGEYKDITLLNGGIFIINHNGTGICASVVVTYGGIYPIGRTRHVSVGSDTSLSDSGKNNINISKNGSNKIRITSDIDITDIYYLLLGEK